MLYGRRSVGRGRTAEIYTTGTGGLGFMIIGLMLLLGFASCMAWSAAGAGPDGGSQDSALSRALGGRAAARLKQGYDSSTPQPSPAPAAEQPATAQAAPAPPASEQAAPAQPAPAAPRRMRVAGTDGVGVVLRTAPREDARVPRGLAEGMLVTVLGPEVGAWTQVRADNGQEGWVPSTFLAPAN